MFDNSINKLNSGLDNLKDDNLDSASTDISTMEAYLPIGKFEDINNLSSQYVTVFCMFCSDDYIVDCDRDIFKRKLISIGEKIKKNMNNREYDQNVRSDLNQLSTELIYTGEVQKIDEESELGKMIRSII